MVWVICMRLLLGCFLAAGLLGQTWRFDLARYEAPAGWKEERGRDAISYTHIAQGTFCKIELYNSREGSGDVFAEEWKQLVQSVFTAGPAPRPVSGVTPGGLRYLEGRGAVKFANAGMWGRLMVFQAEGRVASVFVVASNEAAMAARDGTVQAFLGSLRFGGGSSASTVPASSVGVAGVYMGFRPVRLGGAEMGPRWYVFFKDGRVYEDLPPEGLWEFSGGNAAYWGKYQGGQIARAGARVTETVVEGNGRMTVDGTQFVKCAGVDGLRLEGAWTSFADANDPALMQIPVGRRPLIRFSRDGRFVDEGVFGSILQGYGDAPAGQGTYEIREFSLVLRYAGSEVRRVAISGLLAADPAVKNEVLFLGRAQFNKRR